MRRASCLLILVAAATMIDASAASAQRLGPPQKRPKLVAGADTNDASAYLAHGAKRLDQTPDEAAAAFYWAARLDPTSADALYGRRIALLMRRNTTLKSYMSGSKKARSSKEFRMIDSMQLRALRLDPFLYRRHDRAMMMAYYRLVVGYDGSVSIAEVDQYILRELDNASPAFKAWFAYSSGRMEQALVHYDDAVNRQKDAPGLLMDRARVHALKGQVTPALSDFTAAVELLKERDAKKDEEVIFYDSKALAEHSIGLLWAQKGDLDSAVAAFGRATAEDLSYYPAHLALAGLALVRKDTVAALSAIALAADVAVEEAYVQHMYGNMLLAMGQHAEAVVPLRKAIDLEPLYAPPHFALAQALERASDATGARASYERFLTVSPRRSPERAAATDRLAALGGAAAK